ncbi:uncharacterized protein LOC118415654 [Branchiostoma floridae]|uniref:Uncharacterized protein LOC118415654 n=1 Tax=Branchiostoma floridae TaxID=7739 RepID=A0A9J7L6L5_BRAFL|nr:uncharacterized protein LOC118415654 [Branchiostoma floridae]
MMFKLLEYVLGTALCYLVDIVVIIIELVSKPWKWLMKTRNDKDGDEKPRSRYHEYRVRLDAEQERHAKELFAIRRRKRCLQANQKQEGNFLRLRFEDFPPADQTDLIRRGTVVLEGRVRKIEVPTSFKDIPLAEQLERYHDKIKLDDEETKHAVQLVSIFIGAITDCVIAEIDYEKPLKARPSRIEYTGSMYEGTKVHRPDEFDIMVVIDVSEEVKSEEMTPGYARFQSKKDIFDCLRTVPRFFHCLQLLTVPEDFSHSDFVPTLSPTKTMDWFHGLVQRGVNGVSKQDWGPVKLYLSRHGPAVKVNIVKEGTDLHIAVDLVVSLSNIDGTNEYRRECLRILKSIFEKRTTLAKFTSYHLKTVLLHECRSQGNWQRSKRDERFMDLLERRT